MIIWLDAQLPPGVCRWFRDVALLEAKAVRDLGLRDAADLEIFMTSRKPGIVIISKDADFVDLVQRLGPPPQIVRLTCGNVSNTALVTLLERRWTDVRRLLDAGEPVVELG